VGFGAWARGVGVCRGSLRGMIPTNGVAITDTNNLLPIAALSLSGNGSGLTNLNADNLYLRDLDERRSWVGPLTNRQKGQL
jgi:hypothetical protein